MFDAIRIPPDLATNRMSQNMFGSNLGKTGATTEQVQAFLKEKGITKGVKMILASHAARVAWDADKA